MIVKSMRLILFLGALATGEGYSQANSTAQDGVAPPGHRLALLVGINNYANVADLGGAVNDVEIMRSLLTESFAFREEDILTLTDEGATREAILDAFESHLIEKATDDSIAVFHFSGHGSQIADANGDELDGLDETLVPHDSGREPYPNRDITDDEINALLERLSAITPNVTFVFDSCHSGTATRGSAVARQLEADLRQMPTSNVAPIDLEPDRETGLRPSNASYVLISGARGEELSREHRVNGRFYGALTWHLVQQIRQTGGDATYADIMDLVRMRVSSIYPAQHPQLEGTNRQQYVFNSRSVTLAPYVMASPQGDQVQLSAGIAHGVTARSVYDVYSPGTRDFVEEFRVAEIEIGNVGPTTSVAEVIDGGPIDEASRAIEREHYFPDAQLRVHVMQRDENSEALQGIEQGLSEYGHVALVDEPAGYDLLIREIELEDGSKSIVTEGGDPTEISPRVSSAVPDAADIVVRQVLHWAKWMNTLGIRNETSELSVSFDITGNGADRSLLDDYEVDRTFQHGDQLTLTILNSSNQSVYVTVLYLSNDGRIGVVFPELGQEERLASGETWSRVVTADVPEGRSSIRDVVKVIATSSYSDFGFLSEGAVPRGTALSRSGGTRNPLEQLLAQGALGTSRAIVAEQTVPPSSWVTAEMVLEIRGRETL